MLLSLINNIAFLVALVAAVQVVLARFHKNKPGRQVVLGLLFGCTTLLGMLNPVSFAPGLIFDGRSIVLLVAGLVGGGGAAAIAASMAAIYRYQLGGIGASIGITIILQSALLGVLARQWWLFRGVRPRPIHYLALGVVAQIGQLVAFTQFPDRAGYAFIEQAWWVLLLLYPLATMLLCMIFSDYEQQLVDREALQCAKAAVIAEERASMQRFHAYFDHSIVGLAITSPEKGWVEVNDALLAMLGYSRDELTAMTWADVTYPEDLPSDLSQFNRMLAGEINSYTMEKRFIHKNGQLVDTQLAISHVRKPNGCLDYVLMMAYDITERKQMQSLLMRERQLFQTILDNAPLGIWMASPSGKIQFVNKTFCDAVGIAEQQFVEANHYAEVLPSATAANCMRSDQECLLQNGGVCQSKETLHFVDGKDHLLEISKVKIVNEQAQTLGILGLALDVTERKVIEEQLRKLSLSVEQNPLSIVITDLEGRVEYANAAFTDNSGYTLAEIVGQNPRLLQSGLTPRANYESLWNSLSQGETWRGKFINRRKDGTIYTEFAIISPIYQAEGRVSHFLAIKEDITERIRAQQELDQHRHQLQELVKERTAELELAKVAAETASIAKSAFLANMSHEIRTPIHGILGLAHLLRRGEATSAQADKLDKIDAAGQHLLSLINDILDISKIEAGKLVLDEAPVHIHAIVGNVRSMLFDRAQAKGLELAADIQPIPSHLRGDPTRIQQALLNYVTNALKFTEAGTVTLRVRCQEETPTSALLHFTVQDTGIGIDSAIQSRLFSAFEQGGDTTSQKFGGTGLGLAITRHLAERMDGNAGFVSHLGQGSTFWFTARLQKDPGAAKHSTVDLLQENAEKVLKRDFAGRRILLAEDEAVNREIALFMLEDTGLQIDTAEDGDIAVEMAARTDYSLILMDMRLPTLDGVSATQLIRATATGRQVPILAMTANAFAEDRRRCMEAGMNDFIAKPFNPEGLFAVILKWLQRESR